MSASANSKNLISKLLVLDPSKRLTLEQILAHPFMNFNRIPKQLPPSVLSQNLSKTFADQYVLNGGSALSGKIGSGTIKAIESSKEVEW